VDADGGGLARGERARVISSCPGLRLRDCAVSNPSAHVAGRSG
jgi:hypothetical protein